MRSFVAFALTLSLLSLCLLSLPLIVVLTPVLAQENSSIEPDGGSTISIWIPVVAAEGRGLNVNPALDPSRAVSKTIPPTGGTITATSADGDSFTLTLPAGALNITTTITMTPVTSIAGSPLGAPTAGVQIAPDMLGLWKTATLRVDSAPAVPVAEQVSFAWFAGGSDFHRYPLTRNPAVIEFGINRLHGFGIGRALSASATELAPVVVDAPLAELESAAIVQEDWSPSDPLATISHNLQRTVQQMRENALAGKPDDPALWEQVKNQMRAAWESAIKPTLAPMTQECEYAHATMNTALSWTRDLQLLGIHEQFASEIAQVNDAIVLALENCLGEAAEPCFLLEDVAQTVEVLGYLRALQLIGGDDTLDIDDLPQCQRISVQLNGARGKHFPMTVDPETDWNTKALYTIDDSNVAGVLQVLPFNFGGTIAGGWQAAANITVQARLGDEWRQVEPFGESWHCRDKVDERIDAVIIEISDPEFAVGMTAPKAPVQVLASGVGCWRWEVEHTYSSTQRADLPQRDVTYTLNTTLEFTGSKPFAFWDTLMQQVRIGGDFMQFGLIGEGSLQYKIVTASCSDGVNVLNVNKEPPEHFGGTYSKTWNFNLDPNAPRDTGNDIGFLINEAYEGPCSQPVRENYLFMSPADDLAQNGRSAQGVDSGYLGEQSGTYTESWNYTALRQ